MAEPSALQHVLDPFAATPPQTWLWPLLVGGLAACIAATWLAWGRLRALGEPWGALPGNLALPGLALAVGVMLLPGVLHYGPVEQWPEHAPLAAGAFGAALSLAALALLAVLQVLKPPHRRLQWLAFRPAHIARALGVYAIMIPAFLGLVLAVVSAGRLAGLDVTTQPQVQQLTGRDSSLWIAGVYVLAAVAAPLREELIFRLVLFGLVASLATNSRWSHPARLGALGLSTVLFVAAHGAWWPGFLPLALLGAMLAALFAHTRSIWPPVIVHAAHNALVLTLQFFVL
ncbi:MAG: CPBP family intramembrane metalloprotease [Planctomycetes bacterium]|jgi:membrane protease YdiL (CAAX protease family)|nr:CPBP family intramembrane metalloprotease [Planctomycetota bacterium]MCL4729325.1 CPBP family intramembrane metalloprotease [Planctomycetota bacterium]